MSQDFKECVGCSSKIKVAAKFCPQCGKNQPEQRIPVCRVCESKQVQSEGVICRDCESREKIEKELERVRAQKEIEAEAETSDTIELRPKRTKKWIMVLPVLLAIAVVTTGFVVNISPSQPGQLGSSSSSNSTSGQKPKETLTLVMLGSEEELSSTAKGSCKALDKAVLSSLTYDEYTNRLSALETIDDAYEASALDKKVDWLQEIQMDEYKNSLRDQVKSELDELLSAFEKSSEYTVDEVRLGDEFVAVAIKTCGLTESYAGTVEALTNLDKEASRVSTLAATVPWYPKGYEEFSSDFATKHLDGETCSQESVSCAIFNVISPKPCGTVYVEIEFFDKSDKVVDTSFENMSNLEALKGKKIELLSIVTNADTYNIKDITCSS